MTPIPWIQVYDPLASPWLSTAAAALPIVLLLFTLALCTVLGLLFGVPLWTLVGAGQARMPRGQRRARPPRQGYV